MATPENSPMQDSLVPVDSLPPALIEQLVAREEALEPDDFDVARYARSTIDPDTAFAREGLKPVSTYSIEIKAAWDLRVGDNAYIYVYRTWDDERYVCEMFSPFTTPSSERAFSLDPGHIKYVDSVYQAAKIVREWKKEGLYPDWWKAQRLRESAEITKSEISAAAKEAEKPTEGQAEAGNYRHGKIRLFGLDISIENAKGSTRSGTDKDGKPWSVKMPAHYGYVCGVDVGADGDHVDLYIGDNPESEKVWVVDQLDADTGKFDEHKCLVAFATKDQAKETYLAGFSDGKGNDRLGGMTEMSVDEFKEWLSSGDTKEPVGESVDPDDFDLKAYVDSAFDPGYMLRELGFYPGTLGSYVMNIPEKGILLQVTPRVASNTAFWDVTVFVDRPVTKIRDQRAHSGWMQKTYVEMRPWLKSLINRLYTSDDVNDPNVNILESADPDDIDPKAYIAQVSDKPWSWFKDPAEFKYHITFNGKPVDWMGNEKSAVFMAGALNDVWKTDKSWAERPFGESPSDWYWRVKYGRPPTQYSGHYQPPASRRRRMRESDSDDFDLSHYIKTTSDIELFLKERGFAKTPIDDWAVVFKAPKKYKAGSHIFDTFKLAVSIPKGNEYATVSLSLLLIDGRQTVLDRSYLFPQSVTDLPDSDSSLVSVRRFAGNVSEFTKSIQWPKDDNGVSAASKVGMAFDDYVTTINTASCKPLRIESVEDDLDAPERYVRDLGKVSVIADKHGFTEVKSDGPNERQWEKEYILDPPVQSYVGKPLTRAKVIFFNRKSEFVSHPQPWRIVLSVWIYYAGDFTRRIFAAGDNFELSVDLCTGLDRMITAVDGVLTRHWQGIEDLEGALRKHALKFQGEL